MPDTASQCSTDSKKQKFMEKKLKELGEFDLNNKLKKVLQDKRNDPATQRTFKNLDNIQKNARLKI